MERHWHKSSRPLPKPAWRITSIDERYHVGTIAGTARHIRVGTVVSVAGYVRVPLFLALFIWGISMQNSSG